MVTVISHSTDTNYNEILSNQPSELNPIPYYVGGIVPGKMGCPKGVLAA